MSNQTAASLTHNARRFLASKPTLIGSRLGHRFYEHPTRGDEAPLLVITRDGSLKRSPFWEIPSLDEIVDWNP